MTDSLTTPDMTPRPDTSPDATAAAADPREEGGELVWVDPGELVLGLNVRRDTELDKQFCDSIASHGVRTPITARRDGEGRLVVRTGQRRTLAALRAGRRVPVFVEPGAHLEDDASATVDRIVDQLGENHHRARTRATDQVAAHQELLELGLSANQIAKRTHLTRREAKTLHTVAASPVAAGVLERHDQLDLAQAAAIAEFDDGADTDREVVAALVAAATRSPGQFDHVLQRARDDREEARLIREAENALREQGVRILGARTDTDGDAAGDAEEDTSRARALGHLRASADSPTGHELTAEDHAGCAGHAAKVSVPPSFGRQTREARVVYYCTDPARHGHLERYPSSGSSRGREELTDEEREQQRHERRRTIRLNKEWDSATTVRHRWLTQLLARKTAPRGAMLFIATVLTSGSHAVRKAMETGNRQACALLGLPETTGYYSSTSTELTGLAAQASPQRATQLALAVLLGGIEQSLGRHSWRNVSPDTRLYLTTLREWGYTLTEVEALAAGETPQEPGDAPGEAPTGDSGPDGSQAYADVSVDDPARAEGQDDPGVDQ